MTAILVGWIAGIIVIFSANSDRLKSAAYGATVFEKHLQLCKGRPCLSSEFTAWSAGRTWRVEVQHDRFVALRLGDEVKLVRHAVGPVVIGTYLMDSDGRIHRTLAPWMIAPIMALLYTLMFGMQWEWYKRQRAAGLPIDGLWGRWGM